MNNMIPINPSQVPARAQQRMAQGKGVASHFADGVGQAIDILSIRGKNFHERIGGEEIVTPRPVYEYDAVILDGTPGIGKTYYINPYVDGSMAPPDCWSLNGIKPDPQSPHIQAPTCRGCKWNVFGSRVMTDRPGQQSKAKACQDSRRVALLPANRLAPADGSDPNPLLLRIPATSLLPLKIYAQELERMGIPANAVITRLGFDQNVTHPQLTFTVAGVLTDEQYSHVEYLLRTNPNTDAYDDDRVRRILEAPPPGDEVDPAEFAGHQVTNRNQIPAPAAAAPAAVVWHPKQVQEPAPAAAEEVITLPDGQFYNTRTKEFVVPTPAAPARPDTVIDLPDGRLFDMATRQYWEEPKAPLKPISERAKAPPPVNAPPAAAGAAPTGWKPAPAPQSGPVPGPGWRPPGSVREQEISDAEVPDFLKKRNGPVIQGEVVEAKEEPKPEPKKRKPAPPVEAAADAAQEAPASLDALLNGLELDK